MAGGGPEAEARGAEGRGVREKGRLTKEGGLGSKEQGGMTTGEQGARNER